MYKNQRSFRAIFSNFWRIFVIEILATPLFLLERQYSNERVKLLVNKHGTVHPQDIIDPPPSVSCISILEGLPPPNTALCTHMAPRPFHVLNVMLRLHHCNERSFLLYTTTAASQIVSANNMRSMSESKSEKYNE